MPSTPSKPLGLFPPIYILSTHISPEKIRHLEGKVASLGGTLADDAQDAKIFIGKIERKARAAFELRLRNIWSQEDERAESPTLKRKWPTMTEGPEVIEIDSDESSASDETVVSLPDQMALNEQVEALSVGEDRLLVIRLAWVERCFEEKRAVPLNSFTVYDARVIPKPYDTQSSSPSNPLASHPSEGFLPQAGPQVDILARFRAAAKPKEPKGHPLPFQRRRRLGGFSSTQVTPPKVRRLSTSEFEDQSETLPNPPDWVTSHQQYSCLRSTPPNPPNAHFISELQKIRESRILTLDEIGVRAYSTAIASIAAYPSIFKSPAEVLRLPGCEERIAAHFSEYQATLKKPSSPSHPTPPYLPEAYALDQDENLQSLKILFNIYGVGADTAHRWLFNNGWQDLDDVVEHGWPDPDDVVEHGSSKLSRIQQIGVKYYEEFLQGIPRAEVVEIADIVLAAARRARSIDPSTWDTDQDMVAVIVGGYRRGKSQSGDVDVILSHRNESVTQDLVEDVIVELEQSGHVTHTLSLHTSSSRREGATLPFNSANRKSSGFDSLDKALCVWQDPHFPDSDQTSEAESGPPKNPNPHRRVDIIISPWRTVGCAVLGWSGGTTFQRDIRRFCKRKKGWKFDSSGVRDMRTGKVLELEGPGEGEEEGGWLGREKRLMIRLGIGWREASERCTM